MSEASKIRTLHGVAVQVAHVKLASHVLYEDGERIKQLAALEDDQNLVVIQPAQADQTTRLCYLQIAGALNRFNGLQCYSCLDSRFLFA